MTVARWQGWAGLALGGVALVAGLITIRGDEDPAEALRRFAREQARLKRARPEPAAAPAAPDLRVDLIDPQLLAANPQMRVVTAALAVEVTTTELRLDGVTVTPSELTDRARRAADAAPTVEATITSSTDVPYARVVEVMDALRAAGVEHIALSAAP